MENVLDNLKAPAKSIWSKLLEIDEHRDLLSEWGDFPKALLRDTDMKILLAPCDKNSTKFVKVMVGKGNDIIKICTQKYYFKKIHLQNNTVYALNTDALFELIAENIKCYLQIEEVQSYWKLGYIKSKKNYCAPVFVYIGNAKYGVESVISTLILKNYHPFLLIVPTKDCIIDIAHDAIQRSCSKIVGLDEMFEISQDVLSLTDRITDSIDGWIEGLTAGSAVTPIQVVQSKSPYQFPVQSGGVWNKVVIEFVAQEVINVKYENVSRRLEPEHLDMKSQKTGRPTSQWALLTTFAMFNGYLSWKDRHANKTIKKQKQELSEKLKIFFRINDDPIIWDKTRGCYKCKFIIRESPKGILSRY